MEDELEALGRSLVFVGDKLEVRDKEHLGKLDRKRWSASGIKAIEGCPARWAADKLIPREPDPFGAAELGTAAHKVLEVLYGLPMPERTMDRAMSILATLEADHASEVDSPDDAGALVQWRGEVAQRVAGDFDIEDPTTIDVVGTEHRITGTLAGVPLIGFIDRLDRTPEGLAVRDYKAGRYRAPSRYGDDHGDQIRLYAAAMRDQGHDIVGGTLLYIGASKRRDVVLSQPDIERVTQGFVDSWQVMKDSAARGAYDTSSSALCGWCPMATVCPTAARDGKAAPKVDGAMLGTRIGIRSEPSAVATNTPADTVAGILPATPAAPENVVTHHQEQRKQPMYQWSASEDKSWVPRLPNGQLNPNSYEAMGLCGLSSLAAELIFDAIATDPALGPVKPVEITALARTLLLVSNTVEAELTGAAPREGSGMGSRIRGVLRSVLEFTPLPIGQDAAAWEKWTTQATSRCKLLLNSAMTLFVEGAGEQPWTEIAKEAN